MKEATEFEVYPASPPVSAPVRNGVRERACFPLLPLPAPIKSRYERLVLVTDARHVAQLDAANEDDLIVSSDWLLWQRCLHENRHAVHLELGVLDWDGKRVGHDHLVWANDWIYADGRDSTVFRGVSLGRKFYRDVALVIADYHRLSAMLDSLIRRFGPRELVFHDCRTEDGFMDGEGRVALAAEAAARADIGFVDRRQPATDHESGYPRAGQWEPTRSGPEHWKARLLRWAVDAYVVLWGRLSLAKRRLSKSSPGVLLVMTYITGKPLIDGFRQKNLVPMYLARWMPHKAKLSYWTERFRNRILPVDSPAARLDDDDIAVLAGIEDRIRRNLGTARGACERAVRRFVEGRIIGNGELRRMAKEVKRAERLIDDFAPALVVTDGLMDVTCLIFLELTKRRGIPAAVTWHGPYVEDVKVDMFGCDPRMESLSDYSLTWGRAHEEWLSGIGAKCRIVRVGNLVASRYRGLPPAPGRGNVLVLQYVLTNHDFVTPMSQEYFCFVEVVRMLRSLGYKSIRIRFHPGTSKRSYYHRICDLFGLDCEMSDVGAFSEVLEWADIVVGPANSGAMAETIAAGRPYYPIALAPHAINKRYLAGSPIFEELADLRQALDSRRPLDQSQFLENFTSISEFPDAAARTWQVVEGLVGARP